VKLKQDEIEHTGTWQT